MASTPHGPLRFRSRASGSRSGAVLVMGLMVVVVVMLLAGTFTRFASVITRSSVEGVDRKRAFYVAEAAAMAGRIAAGGDHD